MRKKNTTIAPVLLGSYVFTVTCTKHTAYFELVSSYEISYNLMSNFYPYGNDFEINIRALCSGKERVSLNDIPNSIYSTLITKSNLKKMFPSLRISPPTGSSLKKCYLRGELQLMNKLFDFRLKKLYSNRLQFSVREKTAYGNVIPRNWRRLKSKSCARGLRKRD